jgi:hypothetical protein
MEHDKHKLLRRPKSAAQSAEDKAKRDEQMRERARATDRYYSQLAQDHAAMPDAESESPTDLQ